jgi:RimJ/RimL family protein N-acetyltransferase
MRETQRLLLEPWDERHRSSWRLICRDAEVMRYIGRGQVWEREKADEVFGQALAHWQDHGFGWRSAHDKATGDWLGFVGLNYIESDTQGLGTDEVEIGWWIIRAAWGRGYASEGAAAIRDEAFERIGLDRIIARLQPANVASGHVAEKIGMSFHCDTIGRVGEVLHIYALDRAEWSRQPQSDE